MTTWLPVGPPALGFEIGADVAVDAGWLVRDVRVPAGLDGPDGILQGGFAAAVGLLAARSVDPFGAPLTGISARLEAPTPVGAELRLALSDADGAARYRTELRAGDRRLVSATIELAGHDPAPVVADLLELATVPLPPREPQELFPHCFVCGAEPRHPHGQRCLPGWSGEAVVNPWVADDEVADDRGLVDPLVVSAMLDCPGAWSAMRPLRTDGWVGCLLAGFEVRTFREVPVMEPLRLVARTDAIDGRKVRVRSALVDEDEVTYALASALHVAVSDLPGTT